jgi:hypothetical protein
MKVFWNQKVTIQRPDGVQQRDGGFSMADIAQAIPNNYESLVVSG